jgi:SIR2-like domain
VHVAFFFGAGVSVPSGLPTAIEATKSILTLSPGKENAAFVDILSGLSRLYETDLSRQGMNRTPTGFISTGPAFKSTHPNYEDIHYICSEIGFWEQGRCDSVFVTSFIEKCGHELTSELLGNSNEERIVYLVENANAICDYIEDRIASSLRKPYQHGLDIISDFALDNTVSDISVFSLNHDNLLEQFLMREAIEYTDGFGDADGDVRWSDASVYKRGGPKTKIYKLHGAVNWYRFWKNGKLEIGHVDKIDLDSLTDAEGKIIRPIRSIPYFLTGKDKAFMYHSGFYNEVFFHFSSILKDINHVVMSGYSWGDFTINTFFEGWLDSSPQKRLIILHENVGDLENGSFTYKEGIRGWLKSGQIVVIPKWLCNTSAQEIIATR